MTTILIISMFRHALHKQVTTLNKKINLTKVRVVAIKALPCEIEQKLHGRQFDIAFIDRFYENEEVGLIREHITGLQKNQIKRF